MNTFIVKTSFNSMITFIVETIILITRLDQSSVLDWKVSSILFKTTFIRSHISC